MDWLQAQSLARSGKYVKRADWPLTKLVTDNSGTLEVTDERLFSGPYYPSADDRAAQDWAEGDTELLRLGDAVKSAEQVQKAASEKHDVATAECDAATQALADAQAAYTAAGGVLPPPPVEGGDGNDTLAGGTAREEGGSFFGGKSKKK